MNKLLFALPAFLDNCEICLKLIATIMISASVVHMLSSSHLVFTSLLAIYFLKKRFYRHHFAAIFAIILGIALVGVSMLLNEEKHPTETHTIEDLIIGMIVLQIGEVLGATGNIVEEKILGDQEALDPLLVVGYEGIAGFCIWAVLLPVFQFVPCSINSLCSNGCVEDTQGAMEDYAANPNLIWQSVLLLVLSGASNAVGVSITKYGSAASRATVGLAKNMFVWIAFLTIPIPYWSPHTKEWETRIIETFTFL